PSPTHPLSLHDALPISFADGAAPLLRADGAVIVQALLDPEELLPGDVAGMGIAQDDRPRLRRDSAGAALHARRLPRQQLGAGPGDRKSTRLNSSHLGIS